MPTYLKIIIGLIIAAGVVYAGNVLFFGLEETEHDFRQAKWGMIATVAALGLISFIVLRRRKSAVN